MLFVQVVDVLMLGVNSSCLVCSDFLIILLSIGNPIVLILC